MTLNEAKILLDENNIVYSELHFDSVAAFGLHLSPFANLKNVGLGSVILLEISSKNNHKNIGLQFVDRNNDGNYSFIDLYFGQYFYELFDCQEEFLPRSIIDEIETIVSNDCIIIVTHDFKRGKWVSDQIFDKKETGGFGLPGFEKAMKRIHEKKNWIAKLFGFKMQYEIYDWNTYQCIIK